MLDHKNGPPSLVYHGLDGTGQNPGKMLELHHKEVEIISW